MKKTVMILLVVSLVGCAGYNTRGAMPVTSRVNDTKLIKAEKDGIAITAFPILNEDDSRRYFDENLLDYRILALFLDVFNKTSNEVKVASSELKIGQIVLEPSTTDVMYKAVKREYAGKAFLWMFPTLYIGAPISAIHTYRINKEIEADMKEKRLDFGKEIKPLGMSQGFVWFKIPDKTSPEDKGDGLPKGMVLNLVVEIGKEKEAIKYELSIPN